MKSGPMKVVAAVVVVGALVGCAKKDEPVAEAPAQAGSASGAPTSTSVSTPSANASGSPGPGAVYDPPAGK